MNPYRCLIPVFLSASLAGCELIATLNSNDVTSPVTPETAVASQSPSPMSSPTQPDRVAQTLDSGNVSEAILQIELR